MLIVKKNQIGIFYLIYPQEYAIAEVDVYKFGVHQNLTFKTSYNRFNKYKGGSEIIIYYKIENLYENENKIKEFIIKENIKYSIGNEYFKGNLKEIHDKIYEIIKDDIINVSNLDEDILNDKFRKINIYFDEHFNKKYLNYIKNKFNETNIINNYNYRNSNMRYLINDYKYKLLEYKNYFNQYIIDKNDNKIEILENIKNNLLKYLYICHHCIIYKTYNLCDMIQHFEKNNKCKCLTGLSYEDANLMSRRKYLFTFDNTILNNDDYNFIISTFDNNINIINSDFISYSNNYSIYKKSYSCKTLIYSSTHNMSLTKEYNIKNNNKKHRNIF